MWWIDAQDVMGSAEHSSSGARQWVDVGDSLPAAVLPAHDGGEVSLANIAGKRHVVLFFYPKANTSG